MLKETGYQEKFEMLRPWLASIIELIKKDLRNEHLKIDREFCRKYFLGKNFMQASIPEMTEAYYQDIQGGNVGLGEFIASRWLLKHTDIYEYFEGILKRISTDFDTLETLTEEVSLPLIAGATREFGATQTYVFSVLNCVVFPEKFYIEMRESALIETKGREEKKEAEQIAESLEAMQKRHVREMSALTDRYEKKLNGLQRKYLHDIDILKKQVSRLQKKLTHE